MTPEEEDELKRLQLNELREKDRKRKNRKPFMLTVLFAAIIVVLLIIWAAAVVFQVGNLSNTDNGQHVSSPIPTSNYGQTYTVTLSPATPTPTSSSNSPVGFSRSNAAPIGTTVSFTDSLGSSGNPYNVDMTVEQVLKGADAWNLLNSAQYNSNEAAPAGKEYMLVKFKVAVSGGNVDKAYTMSSMLEFNAVSNGAPLPFQFVIFPSSVTTLPESLYSGGSTEGWRGFMINSDDPNPLISYGLSGSSDIWFATN